MYKEVLRSIEGVGIFPSISLILFLGFFVLLIIHLIRKGRSHYEDAAQLPLTSDDEIENYKNG
ncbi:cbb3-type cytochrome oxidase subunit 3 [Fodinibius halophilus]|uniref:Cbb3-type cytochrome c oxidase subunit 3 n=1 Tax=Fodinibius halophilus TaxID=1736908 RepID=A0A6M1TD92_9BACT|nr:cbb3-type cytochrome c oxidase subunit 3 [Fodinibius halophilus]NGP88804.1 cbb3-type cytochrome c oxidase subunit 3 [Fodinibius halophilus]